MERANPLPIGRYWIQLPLEHAIAFAYFLTQKNFVVKEREARNEDDEWTLYVFRVIRPVMWQAEIFGWPNHADGSSIETWMPPPPPGRARKAARWKLAETLVVGVGTIVVAGLIINKWGNQKVKTSRADA
jgi:hypothetical protein